MLDIFIVILPLFLIIFGSAFLVRLKIASPEWQDELNAFALKIGFPALIFSALANMKFSFFEYSDLLLFNSIFLVLSFITIFLFCRIFKIKEKLFRTLFLCVAFGNVAYLGIPVLTQSYGEVILPQASLIVAVYLFWMFTVGIGFLEFSKSKNAANAIGKILFKIVKNPLLLAVIFGLIFSHLNLQMPEFMQKALDMLAASVTPVVLVVIGLFLGKSKIGKLKDWTPSFLFTLITLVVLPILFYFFIKWFGTSPQDFSSSIIDMAMPLAITPFALADEYKLDKNFIARSIVLSTILSVVTIPIWIFVV